MLRNWSEVIPVGSPNAGAIVSGTDLVGVLGATILAETSTGPQGAGIMFNDGLDPTKLYRALIDGPSFPGLVYEDGSLAVTASVLTTYSLYEDNVLVQRGIPLSVSLAGVVPTAKRVALRLTSNGTLPVSNLANLSWAFFDQTKPGLMVAPVGQGELGSTSPNGDLGNVIIPNSALPDGGVGWLTITDSDGTSNQSPAHLAFSGPVAVSIS